MTNQEQQQIKDAVAAGTDQIRGEIARVKGELAQASRTPYQRAVDRINEKVTAINKGKIVSN